MNARKDFAQELQDNCIAIRVSSSTFGKSRRFDNGQKSATADAVGASTDNVIGGTKLYARNDPYIKRITNALGDFHRLFIANTRNLPGERATRLLKKDRIDEWTADFDALTEALQDACRDADEHYEDIMYAAEQALTRNGKSAFDRMNYPASFSECVKVSWSVHNFRPDESLLSLYPVTYERERQRVASQMNAAVVAFDDACREQLADLVDSLLTKLNPADGTKVKYTEAATTNLREFFDRFKRLNIGSDRDLEDLIDTAEATLGSTTMAALKRSPAQRKQLATQFSAVKTQLDELIVNAPARSIDLDDLED